ncbi:MAG: histidine--tRNA ligase [Spirochaetales bacterium]|nr:histidine--tRNA ligase [Spirochaetales bacterium]
MADLIAPQVLKGFRDALPSAEIPRRTLLAQLERVFASYGFVPIDTPALEYAEILLGKGGGETEKQMFRFEDNGGRDVALRFDLTVPFARFMATNLAQLPLPFKRYHMAKVWRGEKPQKGRYREFYQCDCDIVGVDSAAADFEILSVMASALLEVQAGQFTILVNHRGLFNRFLDKIGNRAHSVEILRTVDKLGKLGRTEILAQLTTLVGETGAEQILRFVEARGNFAEVLGELEKLAGGAAEDSQRLREIFNLLRHTGLEGHFRLAPSITRGLDYYTGVVFETVLEDLPEIGSVCSGGRYNDLANLYTKEKLPGIGGSVGLDRLMAALEELGRLPRSATTSQLLILNSGQEQAGTAQALAAALRAQDVRCEVYLDERKTAAQYKYAESKGIPFVASFGPGTPPALDQPFQLKDIRSGEARLVRLKEALEWINS